MSDPSDAIFGDIIELHIPFDRDYWDQLREASREQGTSVTQFILEACNRAMAVSKLPPGESIAGFHLTPEQIEAISTAVVRHKIEAIKLFRKYTGVGLVEAKRAVENRWRS